MLWIQIFFEHAVWFGNWCIWRLASHIQFHMHAFSNSVGLLGSSHDTALHLGDEELRYKPSETTVQQNCSNPHKEDKRARLHQQMHFYITFAFVNTIGLI